MYLLSVPSVFSRYFNKIKRTSYLGKWPALSLEILRPHHQKTGFCCMLEPLWGAILNQNICCGYSKEPSQWDGSFEHPKHMIKLMGKKHPRSLIIASYRLQITITTTCTCTFSILWLASVAKQAGLSITWSQTPKMSVLCYHGDGDKIGCTYI